MSERIYKIIGILIVCLGFGFLYYGAQVPMDEIAALSSKILGIISAIGGAIITFLGGKKKK